MIEYLSIVWPVGLLFICAYCIGYMSGSDATKEIYNPVLRKNDIK